MGAVPALSCLRSCSLQLPPTNGENSYPLRNFMNVKHIQRIVRLFHFANFIFYTNIDGGNCMIHNMKLNPEPFRMIAEGQKTIELRLYDEKRQLIHAGDQIRFTNNADGSVITATVQNVYIFDSFKKLYENLPLLKCGYNRQNLAKAKPEDMLEYYSEDQQKKHGVVGIEIALNIL